MRVPTGCLMLIRILVRCRLQDGSSLRPRHCYWTEVPRLRSDRRDERSRLDSTTIICVFVALGLLGTIAGGTPDAAIDKTPPPSTTTSNGRRGRRPALPSDPASTNRRRRACRARAGAAPFTFLSAAPIIPTPGCLLMASATILCLVSVAAAAEKQQRSMIQTTCHEAGAAARTAVEGTPSSSSPAPHSRPIRRGSRQRTGSLPDQPGIRRRSQKGLPPLQAEAVPRSRLPPPPAAESAPPHGLPLLPV